MLTFQGNVGSGQGGTWCPKFAFDQRCKCLNIRSLYLNTFDCRHSPRSRYDRFSTRELVQDGAEELMRDDKNDESGAFDDICKMWDSRQVLWQVNVGKIMRVLMGSIDHIGEFLPINLGSKVSTGFDQ